MNLGSYINKKWKLYTQELKKFTNDEFKEFKNEISSFFDFSIKKEMNQEEKETFIYFQDVLDILYSDQDIENSEIIKKENLLKNQKFKIFFVIFFEQYKHEKKIKNKEYLS